jgi:hypothetical protein
MVDVNRALYFPAAMLYGMLASGTWVKGIAVTGRLATTVQLSLSFQHEGWIPPLALGQVSLHLGQIPSSSRSLSLVGKCALPQLYTTHPYCNLQFENFGPLNCQ